MNYQGKIVKKILKLYPNMDINDAINKFFNYYYFKCGLSMHEIIEYILDRELKNHTTLVMMAKIYGINVSSKGGNHYKYNRNYSCDACGGVVLLRLLVKNKERHNNLALKCTCGNTLTYRG